MKKINLIIAAILICTMTSSCLSAILYGLEDRCDRKMEYYKNKGRDLSIVGIWEAYPKDTIMVDIDIFEADGNYHSPSEISQLKTRYFSSSAIWYTENNIIYRYTCIQYNIQKLTDYRYKIKNDTLYLQTLNSKTDSWATYIRYQE